VSGTDFEEEELESDERPDEVAVSLTTLERLTSLAPDERRLVGLLVLLLRAGGEKRARWVGELGREIAMMEVAADRLIGRLRRGRDLIEQRLRRAVARLPDAVCQELANLARELADEDVAGARQSAVRCCELMQEWLGDGVPRRRRREIVRPEQRGAFRRSGGRRR
jgi:hypothetical protein